MNSYFVSVKLHNGETNGWAMFDQTKRFDSLDDAKKYYHKMCETYIGYGKLDYCSVAITDAFDNVLQTEQWSKPVAVEASVADEVAE